MKRGYGVIIIIWSLLCIGGVATETPVVQEKAVVTTETSFVQDKGVVATYTIPEEAGRVLVSRDGATAYVPQQYEVIEQPGKYYVTYYDAVNQLQMITFTIPYTEQKTYFEIMNRADLHEALKQMFTQQTKKATLTFMNATYTSTELFKMIQDVANEVNEGYPLLIYKTYNVASAGGTNPTLALTVQYPTPSEKLGEERTWAMYTQQAEMMMQKLINQLITPDMLDYEREQVIYRYLADWITYAPVIQGDMIHSLQGTLLNQEGVCDGYARTFMYMMNSVGVPTTLVRGKTGEVGHAWNQIYIQNQFYHVDLTWGDQEKDKNSSIYDYMNESDDYMTKTHKWNRETTQVASSYLYNPIFIPNDEPGVYQVKDRSHWNKLQTTIKDDESTQYTFIFYEVAKNHWNMDALLQTIMKAKRCGVRYYHIEKYDTLIIECTLMD